MADDFLGVKFSLAWIRSIWRSFVHMDGPTSSQEDKLHKLKILRNRCDENSALETHFIVNGCQKLVKSSLLTPELDETPKCLNDSLIVDMFTESGLLSISGGSGFTESGGNGSLGPAIYVEWAVLPVEARSLLMLCGVAGRFPFSVSICSHPTPV